MRRRSVSLLACLLGLAWPLLPRQDPATCGTHAGKATEQLLLHRQAVRPRPRPSLQARTAAASRATDIGDIAVLEDSGDLVARASAFDLDQSTVAFIPTSPDAAGYRFETGAASYDPSAASGGAALTGLGDDDARQVSLPFSFPFYGHSYRQLFVNSDGNLTFGAPDAATSERSLGRMVAGAPRIAPLFRDLDPSRVGAGVTVLSGQDRVVVSWVAVPEYSTSGLSRFDTFQVRLFASGRIEFAYGGVGSSDALVGISPGGRLGITSGASFRGGDPGEYTGTIVQRFSTTQEVDIYSAALKFYDTHEDAYDYLVFFNNMGVAAASGALAYEVTARNVYRTGYGDGQKDSGVDFGSARRLQAVMNMGPLSQYPADPDAKVPGRGSLTGDTTMTILGHEAGHLFLAFASVRDPADADVKLMLKSDGAHWSFNFNSEASLLEGNRLRDNGDGTFTLAGTVEGYSLLDQYLMGLVPPEEVPPTFVVLNSQFSSDLPPWAFSPLTIRGMRRDVRVEELAQVEGRRSPDPTVSQRHFRFAFILIVPAGTTPAGVELAKLESYRSRFAGYYARYTGNRASAETTLRRSLQVSVSPAAGILAGKVAAGTVSIQSPALSPITVALEHPLETDFAVTAPSVVIAAGATSATFQIAGLRNGVEELVARPSDPAYETAYARIRVLPSPSDLRLAPIPGGDPAAAPAAFRLTDLNQLPYAGLSVTASASGGGAVSPAAATSGDNGLVSFQWTPGNAGLQQMTAGVEGATPFTFAGVVNAASFAQGISPGSFASIFGSRMAGGSTAIGLPPYPNSLSGVEVAVGGKQAGIHYASDGQLNVLVPPEVSPGMASLAVSALAGSTTITRVPVAAAAPGIFFDPASGYGAILRNRNVLEIYCTGLGAGLTVTVNLGGQSLVPTFSGPFAGYPGLDLVEVQIPAGLSGEQPVWIEVDGHRSNTVRVLL
jgi:uncharacterized protein (TIGR03437 family)